MIAPVITVLTMLAALGSGLAAGVFFIFSNTVMASLARLPVAQGVAAMQTINVVIINAAFMTVFMGTAILSLALGVRAVMAWGEAGAAWLLAGSIAYLVGSFLVTVIFNVPLNDALAAVDATSTEGRALWMRYLKEWLPWNHVRAVASLVATASFIVALCAGRG